MSDMTDMLSQGHSGCQVEHRLTRGQGQKQDQLGGYFNAPGKD